MKNIIVIMIMILFCAESFASGCATGYACSLTDLKKQQSVQQKKEAGSLIKDYKKQNIPMTSSEKKKKSPKEYQDLFFFNTWLF